MFMFVLSVSILKASHKQGEDFVVFATVMSVGLAHNGPAALRSFLRSVAHERKFCKTA